MRPMLTVLSSLILGVYGAENGAPGTPQDVVQPQIKNQRAKVCAPGELRVQGPAPVIPPRPCHPNFRPPPRPVPRHYVPAYDQGQDVRIGDQVAQQDPRPRPPPRPSAAYRRREGRRNWIPRERAGPYARNPGHY